jgi:5-methylcytosine-specific restriction endonuclease McrA
MVEEELKTIYEIVSETVTQDFVNLVSRRYNSIVNRSKLLKILPPTYDEILQILLNSYKAGFKCEYCGVELLLKDKFPYLGVASIDHRIPLSKCGKVGYSNMAVVCCRCNLVKGTMSSEVYIKLIKLLSMPENKELRDSFFNEIIAGKLAYKIERNYIEKDNSIFSDELTKKFKLSDYISAPEAREESSPRFKVEVKVGEKSPTLF